MELSSSAHCRRASPQGGEQTLARKVREFAAASAARQTAMSGADALTLVWAHVLDIELSEPVAGLQRTTVDGRYADRAWALVRLFGEPLGLDVLEIPAAGLSSEAVTELVLDRRLPRVGQVLEIDG